MTVERLQALFPELPVVNGPKSPEQLEIEGRYMGYIERQEAEVLAFRKDEALRLPVSLDYAQVGGLSTEVRLKLAKTRPATLGAAGRIPGITPAALTALLRHVQRKRAIPSHGVTVSRETRHLRPAAVCPGYPCFT